MNWIILIIAGLFEVGFTFCLGKIKGAAGGTVARTIRIRHYISGLSGRRCPES